MQITTETIEPRQVRLTITFPESRVERAMHAAAQRLGKRMRVKVPGYRHGHLPLREVIAQVGDDVVRNEAIEDLAREAVKHALTTHDLHPYGVGDLEIDNLEPLTLSVLIPLEPEVDLGDYRTTLRVPTPDPEPVSEDDVAAVLERFRADLAFLEPLERASVPGDVVSASLVGRTADSKVVFEDESLTLRLNGKGVEAAHLPEAALEHLTGRSPGDSLTFTLTYPDTWPQRELRDVDVVFEATISTISEIRLPELDDDLASQVSDAETIEELRARVVEGLATQASYEARNAHAEAAVDALVAAAQVSYPPVALEQEVAARVSEVKDRVERQGFVLERWLELQGKDADSLVAELQPTAEERLRRRLVLGAFAAAEGILATQEEINEIVAGIQRSSSPEERRQLPPVSELRERVAARLVADRTLRRLVDIASGKPDGAEASDDPESDEEPLAAPAAQLQDG